MNCGIHRCAAKCHQGRCEDCKHMIECACYCGNERKKVPCIEENINKTDYACDKECERILACGNHKCFQKCHKEVCKECVLLPKFIKSCPCGKKPIKEDERKSCLDPILTCTDKCAKPLKCGPLSNPHKCLVKSFRHFFLILFIANSTFSFRQFATPKIVHRVLKRAKSGVVVEEKKKQSHVRT